MTTDPVVFVVDDYADIRDAVCKLARTMNLRAEPLASAEEFLDRYRGEAGCVIADLRMHGLSGLELQEELRRREIPIPVIVLTGFAHTAAVVRAMRNGAVTVLDKPFDEEELWRAIRDALAQDAEQRRRRSELSDLRERFANLSDKERQVLRMIVAGRPNKAIANAMQASLRTVENRRREVFSKLGVRSVAELVTLALKMDADVLSKPRRTEDAPHLSDR
jgi:FixJ family two-component response regulator